MAACSWVWDAHRVTRLMFLAAVALGLLATLSTADEGLCSYAEPWHLGACTVSSTGIRSSACQQCLVGPEWDTLRAVLGTRHVRGRRLEQPALVQGAWASSTIGTAMLRILAEELLGYEPRVIASTDPAAEVGACNGVDVEVWPSGPTNAPDSAVRETFLGTVVHRGIYAPLYTPPSQISHTPALAGDSPQGVFPPDGTVSRAELSRWCENGDDLCCTAAQLDAVAWNVSTCVEGRWYPPQCNVGSADDYPSDNCGELYLPHPDGFYESLIYHTGWNLSAVYVGRAGMPELVADMHEQKRDFMYAWWEPSSLNIRYPAQRVQLPKLSSHCDASGVAQPGDPSISGGACRQKSLLLRKRMSVALADAEPDLATLFDRWHLLNEDMEAVLALEESAGGSLSMEEAACAFLKSEEFAVRWRQWVAIADPCQFMEPKHSWNTDSTTCEPQETPEGPAVSAVYIPVIVSVVVVGLLLATISIFLAARHHRLRNYVRKLEETHMQQEDVAFATPLSEAIDILKHVATSWRTNQRMKQRAVLTIRNLVTRNIYAPTLQDMASDDGLLENLQHMMAYLNDETSVHGGRAQSSSAASAFLRQSSGNDRTLRSRRSSLFNLTPQRRRTFGGNSGRATPSGSNLSMRRCTENVHRGIERVPTLGRDDPALLMGVSLAEIMAPSFKHARVVAEVGENLMLDALALPILTGDRPLTVTAMIVVSKYNLIQSLELNEDKIIRWLMAVEDGYVEVPYHNATHAADVLSRTVALMKTEHLLQDDTLGSKCYMLACVMAAAIHDYGHPGLDNKFQIASDTEISRRFNQKTVLENYSIFQCLEMLRQRPMDAFDGSKVRKENLISLVIDMVFSTDMADHFHIVGDFSAKVVTQAATHPAKPEMGKPERSAEFFNSLNEQKRKQVMCVALKVADIGHLYTTMPIHYQWCERLEEEFFDQGAQELKLGREPGMLKHPHKPGVCDPKNQVAFFDLIGIPLARTWADVFPTSGRAILEAARRNRNKHMLKTGGKTAPQRVMLSNMSATDGGDEEADTLPLTVNRRTVSSPEGV